MYVQSLNIQGGSNQTMVFELSYIISFKYGSNIKLSMLMPMSLIGLEKKIVQFGSPCKYVYVYIGMPISLLLYSEYFNKGCWMYFQKKNMYELTFVWFDGCNDKKISYGTHYNQDCVCND